MIEYHKDTFRLGLSHCLLLPLVFVIRLIRTRWSLRIGIAWVFIGPNEYRYVQVGKINLMRLAGVGHD